MRRLLCAILALTMLCGCQKADVRRKYSVTWFDCFDTVITLTGYAPSEQVFSQASESAHALYRQYHALFDPYHASEGVNGVWALNHAQGAALRVEPELFELLAFCASLYDAASGKVDVGMGALFAVWHAYREAGANELPTADELSEAQRHGGMARVRLDEEAGTVRLTDPEMRVDLGAVAKGYATQKVGEMLAEALPSFLLDAGGNVFAGDAPADGRANWSIGVQNPENLDDILMVLSLRGLAAVTSGGYQRYYEVDGRRYHHLIDPDTMYPATQCAQVTVLAENSTLADYLSTAAFLLPLSEAQTLICETEGAECLWVMADGTQVMSAGFAQYIQK